MSRPSRFEDPLLPPQALVDFCKRLDVDAGLSAQVKAAATPDQIVGLAQAQGFAISKLELRMFSRQLVADYFPWATKDNAWRHQFFALNLLADNS